MATLSKNGVETHRVELLRKTYSFRSNGKILKNDGFGWKLVTLKAGVTPDQFLANLRSREASLTPLVPGISGPRSIRVSPVNSMALS